MKQRNLSMPAEWQPQSAIWLSWPHNVETWPDNLAAAQQEFVAVVKTIADSQTVNVLCGGTAMPQAQSTLGSIANVFLIDIPTNDAWARDYAPTFVKDIQTGQTVVIDWHYNAWGGKYPPYDQDQQVAARVAKHLDLESIPAQLCFEGGAIEVNASGVLLSTRSCALDPNRNPKKSLADFEQVFSNLLGVQHTIWLAGDAVEGDDTDGHIDQLARFTDDQTIVYAWCDNDDDPQRAGLEKNFSQLKSGMRTLNRDTDCQFVSLNLPPRIHFHGRRMPASYCNFLIANEVVIVPQFGDLRADQVALESLAPLFPNRTVIGLTSLNLSVGLGSFHCLSQQQPV